MTRLEAQNQKQRDLLTIANRQGNSHWNRPSFSWMDGAAARWSKAGSRSLPVELPRGNAPIRCCGSPS